jgi:hypothetical protein
MENLSGYPYIHSGDIININLKIMENNHMINILWLIVYIIRLIV